MATQESWDYVIVGAGSAGCVLANRLTEDPSSRVLLLEAGGEDTADEVRIPAAFASLFKTRWDWNYETVEQKHLGKSAYWPRGKLLGGSSSINAMIYIRGNRADYDEWRDSHGAEGWGWDDVLPYFVRAEGNTRLGGPLHGSAGPLRVEDRVFTHELSRAWVDSAVSWGLKRTEDFNGESQEGAGLYQVTCRKGQRWSAADAYLRPAMGRPNLTVRTRAQATRVVLDGGRATGVSYLEGGVERTAYAESEVLLCGGAINSPQLLLLSGVGPAEHLREHDIEVAVQLPGVGQNLHDHPAAPIIWSTRDTSDVVDSATPAGMLRWQLTKRGPLASNIGEAGAFLSTVGAQGAPDMQFHVAPTLFYDNGLREPTVPGFTSAATLVRVHSRGRLRLRSAHPLWRPELDPAYYADPTDLDAVLSGLRTLIEIGRGGPLARHLDKPFLPNRLDLDEDALAEHVRANTQTLYHPVGTCAMGTGEQAVVDPALRVRGVDRLRVVDASVMPVVPRGNTNAPTIMVAEKAADLIRAQTP
ncbi:GMC family oxidoreductase [Amycolatopsis cihanbeyliensis]|uniref:Choline dehydrogenase n=1 Tax=Amycolatopsis cihanbeyliensis TaxID=1128664 RepID=A0A542DKW5_AMYCI|nr:GMC family oxidoreductase N-terminal domain-containing protein [Amycolatopsis cihanbeyliensis]TQJ03565.1 choline dehydrogenase [Amycolatopsis cihanbeyliensis]